jgi:hypothetical protein
MEISTFFSDCQTRKADILRENNTFVVNMYDNGILCSSRQLSKVTLQYAENLAENFCMQWGEFSVQTIRS